MLSSFELTTWLGHTYALSGAITSELIRSYNNDVFLIRANDDQYVLKLYSFGSRSKSEIQYEVALVDHLAKKGLRIANALAGRDGEVVSTLSLPKGEQYAVLFEYAAGHKPQRPFSNQLYYAFGQAVARIHALSDDFATNYDRQRLDLDFLIDKPLNLTLPLIEKTEDRLFLEHVAGKVREKITELDAHGLDWGPIHGDATLDNLHVTDDGQIVWYDFDMGGPGWRAADLQGWAKNNQEYAERWVAFKQGYASVRELKALDLEAAPYLAVAWLIWALRLDLERRILAQGREQVAAYLREQLDAIRWQAQLAME
jgi:Ser/Thr protein kinase RdoA (MazF antagonist)